MKQTKIESVEIIIAGKKLSLTPTQAKELRDILNEMWPETQPFVPYQPPIIIERDRTYPWERPWPIWYCTADNNTHTATLSLSIPGQQS